MVSRYRAYSCVVYDPVSTQAMLHLHDPAPAFSARPIFGAPLTVPDSARSCPLVLCFVASLASPFARHSLALLQQHFADFDRVGAQVAAVSHTALAAAQDFVPRHQLLFPLVADTDGSLSALYGVRQDTTLRDSARHLLRVGGRGLRTALGHGVGWSGGAVRQLGATFVVDRKAVVQYAHYARGISEPPDVEALRRCIASL